MRCIVADVQTACDLLRPVYEHTGHLDGYVSIEVPPALAYDTRKTVNEAHRLHGAVDRPNLMVKIPGTRQGLSAIRQAIADGLNVNVTLLFAIEVYERRDRRLPRRARGSRRARRADRRACARWRASSCRAST